MLDRTSQFNSLGNLPDKIIIDGEARLSFKCEGSKYTKLDKLYQSDPQRVLFPNASTGEPIQAVIVTTSGGLVGGDKILLEVEMGEKSKATILQQAAEKIYRSTGENSIVNVILSAREDSWLEYIPQEAILFEGAHLQRDTRIKVEGEGQVFAGEIIVFGRVGSGERFESGFVYDRWEITRDGRLVWADALHLDRDIAAVVEDPSCFDGSATLATAVYVGPRAEKHLETAREILRGNGRDTLKAATFVNDILVVRWLGRDAFELRRDFGNFWSTFRNKVAGLPQEMPRLWHI